MYPLLARRMGAQGEVLLRVRVQPDGSVAAVELVRSSGFTLLDEVATRTVRDSWRFIPARLDGAAIESWVEVPIKFVLAES
jgi:protein TonB